MLRAFPSFELPGFSLSLFFFLSLSLSFFLFVCVCVSLSLFLTISFFPILSSISVCLCVCFFLSLSLSSFSFRSLSHFLFLSGAFKKDFSLSKRLLILLMRARHQKTFQRNFILSHLIKFNFYNEEDKKLLRQLCLSKPCCGCEKACKNFFIVNDYFNTIMIKNVNENFSENLIWIWDIFTKRKHVDINTVKFLRLLGIGNVWTYFPSSITWTVQTTFVQFFHSDTVFKFILNSIDPYYVTDKILFEYTYIELP